MKRRLRGYIFFIFCLIFAFPIMGRADENHDINSGNVTITEAGTYRFENYEGANKVIVNAPDKEVDITISGLKIEISKGPNCAFEIQAGTVNLTLEGTNVLKSGNLKAGLQVLEGSTLTIKGDGELNVTGGSSGAGIGVGNSGAVGSIIIQGGTVNANGGSSGAGIGGGSSKAGGDITITGGTVNATGGTFGAGIGGGSSGAGGSITITGGTVTAKGGSSSGAGIGGGSSGTGGIIIITGGTVTATGSSSGAGIGGGSSGAGGDITITGGIVTANGGNSGAGIGGGSGSKGTGGTIKIQGGTVTATGGSTGAGIGGGNYGAGGTITIETGTVNATGGNNAAGIGGGMYGAGGIITIIGGTVTAKGGNMGAQIGGGSNGDGGEITITGGVVNAPISGLGAGIGKGYDGKNNGTFSAKNGNAFINVSSISDQNDKDNWKGIIFDGYNGQVYGKQKLETNVEIPKGKTLTIKEDQKLTLGKGVTLTNNGTIKGIENIIYTVTYHHNNSDESEDVEVAHNSIPSYSNFTRQYYSIDGWHDKASDGQKVKNITGSIDLYANWKENEIKTKPSISDIKGTYGKEIKYDLSKLLSTDSYKDNIIYTSSDLEEYGLSILNKQITGTPKKAIDDNSTVTITISSVDCMKEVEAKVPINIAKGKSSIDEFIAIPNSTYSGKAIDITAPFVKDESGNEIKDAIVGLSYQIKTDGSQYESTTADNSGASDDGKAPKYAGEYKVIARFAGNDNYSEAEAKTAIFTIEKVSLTVNPLPGQIIFPNETGTYKPKYEVTGAVNNETLEFSGDLKLDNDGKTIVDDNLTLNDPFDKNYSMTITEGIMFTILDNVVANEEIILSGTIEDDVYIDQVTITAPDGFLIKSEGGTLTKAENDYKESFIWNQTGTFDINYKLQRINDGQVSDRYIVRVTVKNKSEKPDKPVNPPVEPEEPVKPVEPTVYYTVTLPSVDGVTTDPVAGDYEVEAWDSFRFYLTIGKDYDQSKPVITTSRYETIEPRNSDDAYIIKYVRTNVEIRIDGVVKNPEPVANTEIQSGIKVWGNNHRLFIRTDKPEEVSVYTFGGQLQKKFRSEAGDRFISLPSGTYIVLIADERFKVIL
ncbi:InlB B-repeat-containing protein [Parabacteroides chongii]|uniref:InlB B-repeat-containing protein n=1 Tax=Parabacteroides chongii TaxID=2685834 RepID=UPI00240E4F71|nr:hypothetical protein [Parabacteroides chongii]WFE86555.1 hypothetical protein P3L47_08185 [Parabacteroides chongii]